MEQKKRKIVDVEKETALRAWLAKRKKQRLESDNQANISETAMRTCLAKLKKQRLECENQVKPSGQLHGTHEQHENSTQVATNLQPVPVKITRTQPIEPIPLKISPAHPSSVSPSERLSDALPVLPVPDGKEAQDVTDAEYVSEDDEEVHKILKQMSEVQEGQVVSDAEDVFEDKEKPSERLSDHALPTLPSVPSERCSDALPMLPVPEGHRLQKVTKAEDVFEDEEGPSDAPPAQLVPDGQGAQDVSDTDVSADEDEQEMPVVHVQEISDSESSLIGCEANEQLSSQSDPRPYPSKSTTATYSGELRAFVDRNRKESLQLASFEKSILFKVYKYIYERQYTRVHKHCQFKFQNAAKVDVVVNMDVHSRLSKMATRLGLEVINDVIYFLFECYETRMKESKKYKDQEQQTESTQVYVATNTTKVDFGTNTTRKTRKKRQHPHRNQESSKGSTQSLTQTTLNLPNCASQGTILIPIAQSQTNSNLHEAGVASQGTIPTNTNIFQAAMNLLTSAPQGKVPFPRAKSQKNLNRSNVATQGSLPSTYSDINLNQPASQQSTVPMSNAMQPTHLNVPSSASHRTAFTCIPTTEYQRNLSLASSTTLSTMAMPVIQSVTSLSRPSCTPQITMPICSTEYQTDLSQASNSMQNVPIPVTGLGTNLNPVSSSTQGIPILDTEYQTTHVRQDRCGISKSAEAVNVGTPEESNVKAKQYKPRQKSSILDKIENNLKRGEQILKQLEASKPTSMTKQLNPAHSSAQEIMSFSNTECQMSQVEQDGFDNVKEASEATSVDIPEESQVTAGKFKSLKTTILDKMESRIKQGQKILKMHEAVECTSSTDDQTYLNPVCSATPGIIHIPITEHIEQNTAVSAAQGIMPISKGCVKNSTTSCLPAPSGSLQSEPFSVNQWSSFESAPNTEYRTTQIEQNIYDKSKEPTEPDEAAICTPKEPKYQRGQRKKFMEKIEKTLKQGENLLKCLEATKHISSTEHQTKLNPVSSASLGMMPIPYVECQTTQIVQNTADSAAQGIMPIPNTEYQPAQIEQNNDDLSKETTVSTPEERMSFRSLEREHFLNIIEKNLKRGQKLLTQGENEMPVVKVKLEDGTKGLKTAEEEREEIDEGGSSNDTEVLRGDCGIDNSSKAKDDQPSQKETSMSEIIPSGDQTSLIAQAQNSIPYVVIKPLQIAVPNTICQTVTVAVPYEQYQKDQVEKNSNDEESEDRVSIPEASSAPDAATQDVNKENMPRDYILHKLREKVKERGNLSEDGENHTHVTELDNDEDDDIVEISKDEFDRHPYEEGVSGTNSGLDSATLEINEEDEDAGMEKIIKEEINLDPCEQDMPATFWELNEAPVEIKREYEVDDQEMGEDDVLQHPLDRGMPSSSTDLDDANLKMEMENGDEDKEEIGGDDVHKETSDKVVSVTSSEVDDVNLEMEDEEDVKNDTEEIDENDVHKDSLEQGAPTPSSDFELENAPLVMDVADEDGGSRQVMGEGDLSLNLEVPTSSPESDDAPLVMDVTDEDGGSRQVMGEEDLHQNLEVPTSSPESDDVPLVMDVTDEDGGSRQVMGEGDLHQNLEVPTSSPESDDEPLVMDVAAEDGGSRQVMGVEDLRKNLEVPTSSPESDDAPLVMDLAGEDGGRSHEMDEEDLHQKLSEDDDDDNCGDASTGLDDNGEEREDVNDEEGEEEDNDDNDQGSDKSESDFYPSEDDGSDVPDDDDYEPGSKRDPSREYTSISHILSVLDISMDDLVYLPKDTITELKEMFNLSSAQSAVINKTRLLEMRNNRAQWRACKKHYYSNNEMKLEKDKLMKERDMMNKEMEKLRDQYMELYNLTFEGLQDLSGNPVDPNCFMLQHKEDGTVFLVLRDGSSTPNCI